MQPKLETIQGTVVVKTKNLSKWYGQVISLNDLTLQVHTGVTGLLGPNGAGKSTLLRLLVGQLKPSAGLVRVLGVGLKPTPGLFNGLTNGGGWEGQFGPGSRRIKVMRG